MELSNNLYINCGKTGTCENSPWYNTLLNFSAMLTRKLKSINLGQTKRGRNLYTDDISEYSEYGFNNG